MSTESATWLDGAPASALPLPDRGLDFGDGLFETLLLRRGRPLYTEFHLQRLWRGLQVLAFPDCLDTAREQLACAAADVRKRGWLWAALRLTVTRGGGPRGYTPPRTAMPRIIITASEIDRDCGQMSAAASVCVATVRWATQPVLAGIKHLNRLEQVLAAAECRRAGTDETVLLDQSGRPTSLAAGNLFLMHKERLLTPRLLDCGIEGTRRRLVMDRWAPAIGLNVEEVTLTLQDLATADEIFYSNSLQGVRPVASLGERNWDSHTVCEALFRQFQGELV